MAEMSLVWKGEALVEKMRAAQMAGINKTISKCVAHAKTHHDWENRGTDLVKSIHVTMFAYSVAGGIVGKWGSTGVAYALIHELGGTIRPKRSKFLAVPISDEAKLARSPRNMTNLVFVQSIKGQPMLVDQFSGKVHYLLKKSVTIPARPYLRPAADLIYPELAANIRAAYQKQGGSAPAPAPEAPDA